MDTPGITVRPLRTMHGVDEFAEVFFDDVVVPADRMLGKPGDGWRLAMDLLPHERSTCFWHRIAYLYTRLDRLLDAIAPTARPGRRRPRRRLSGAAHRSLPLPRRRSGAWPTAPRSARRPRSTRCCWPRPNSNCSTPPVTCCPGARARRTSAGGSEYLYSRAATIYGGTAEIQRNIIARRLLDLGKE